jgi:hypothetical protein
MVFPEDAAAEPEAATAQTITPVRKFKIIFLRMGTPFRLVLIFTGRFNRFNRLFPKTGGIQFTFPPTIPPPRVPDNNSITKYFANGITKNVTYVIGAGVFHRRPSV